MKGEAGTGRVAVVTGASRGLGFALAEQLAQNGWSLLVHVRKHGDRDSIVSHLKTLGSGHVQAINADFRDLNEVHEEFSSALTKLSQVDILINNVGTGFCPHRVITADGIEETLQVNYIASLLVMRMHLPLLLAVERGHVINIVSAGQMRVDLNDLMLERHWSPVLAYGRSKRAMLMASMMTSRDIRHFGMRIDAIHPESLMDTDLSRQLQELVEMRNRGGLASMIMRFRLARTNPVSSGVSNVMHLMDKLGTTGSYYHRARRRRPARQVQDDAQLESLSRLTDEIGERVLGSRWISRCNTTVIDRPSSASQKT